MIYQIRIAIRLINLHILLGSYKRVKLNSVRALQGKRPKRSLLEWFVYYSVLPLRILSFLIPFRLSLLPTTRCTICIKLYENAFLRFLFEKTFNFIIGLGISWFIFFVFIWNPSTPRIIVTLISIPLLLIITLGFTFYPKIRCILLLMCPMYCAAKGRAILMVYIYSLITSGPMSNTYSNLKEVDSALVCARKVSLNITREMVDIAKKPFREFYDKLKNFIDAFKQIIHRLNQFLTKLSRLLESLKEAILNFRRWIASMTDKCNGIFGKPAEVCRNTLDIAKHTCYRDLGMFVGSICEILFVVRQFCNISDTLKYFCYAVSSTVEWINREISNIFGSVMNYIREQMYVDVEFTQNLIESEKKNKENEQLFYELKNELENHMNWIVKIARSLQIFSYFMSSWILFAAIYYQLRFATRDGFNNYMITENFRSIEMKRLKMNKEVVLPLNRRQRKKYITPWSFRLTKEEQAFSMAGLTLVFILAIQSVVWIAADYLLYKMLMFLRHTMINANLISNTPIIQIQTEGNGLLAKFYRETSQSLSFRAQKEEMIHCFPEPITPDHSTNIKIFVYLILCFLSCVLGQYILRFRPFIAGAFYPKVVKRRTIWLYNQVLASKGSFVSFVNRKIRRHILNKSEERVSLFVRLMAMYKTFKIIGRILGYHRSYCLSCASYEPTLIKCANINCTGIYCNNCYNSVNNICVLCELPTEAQMDEEKDSEEECICDHDWSYQWDEKDEKDENNHG